MGRRHFLLQAIQAMAVPVVSRANAFWQATTHTLKSLYPRLAVPGDAHFSELKEIFNKDLKPKDPEAILSSSSTKEVQTLMTSEWAKGLPWRVRSGGHSFEGFSMGQGLVFDTRPYKQVAMTERGVRLGAGLQLREAQSELQKLGFCLPNGSCPSVGLAGFLLGGGHSLKSRKWGLGADRVLGMDIVLASGEKLYVSPDQHGDLFWALLGAGGGNLALVENFYIDPIPSRQEFVFNLGFETELAAEVFQYWESFSHQVDDELSAVLILHLQDQKIQQLRIHGVINDRDDGDPRQEFERSAFGPLLALNPVQTQFKKRSASWLRKPGRRYGFKGSSQLADQPIADGGFDHLLQRGLARSRGSSLSLVFEPLQGKISRPKRAIAYPHRTALYILELHTTLLWPSKAEQDKRNLSSLRKDLDPLFSGRAYVNYPDLDIENWVERYYGEALPRLLEIKKTYDPQNRFDFGDHSLSQAMRLLN